MKLLELVKNRISTICAKYINEKTGKIFIIPMHYEIARGTLKSILEQADIELEEFLKYLKS